MLSTYKRLPINLLPVASKLSSPSQKTKTITFDDVAISVMTDLNKVTAITIAACDGISDAEYKMKIRQVKLLFVVDHNEYVIGVVTYNDLYGQKVHELIDETGVSASELCILDIMTGIDAIQTLHLKDVNESTVGDITLTLNYLQCQHVLVLEEKDNSKLIRGLFSTSQISKQLAINVTEVFTHEIDSIEQKSSALLDSDKNINDTSEHLRFSA